MPQKVFIDANVLIEAGQPPGGPLISELKDLVEAGLIEVLTTDLTIQEVAKRHAANNSDALASISRPHFRKLVQRFYDVELPETSSAAIRANQFEFFLEEVGTMVAGLGAKVIEIDNVKPSDVFSKYANSTGLFSGTAKKDQFPDAFIFEALKAEASQATPVTIVSKDRDFELAVEASEHFALVKGISGLLESLELQKDVPELPAFLDENGDAFLKLFDTELNNWGLTVTDVMDAEVEEISVAEIEDHQYVSFGQTGEHKEVLVVGHAVLNTNIAYSHPDWDHAMYDSEDKRLIPFDDVQGETLVSIPVEYSMRISVDEEGLPFEIEQFAFRNSNFQYVSIEDTPDWLK